MQHFYIEINLLEGLLWGTFWKSLDNFSPFPHCQVRGKSQHLCGPHLKQGRKTYIHLGVNDFKKARVPKVGPGPSGGL